MKKFIFLILFLIAGLYCIYQFYPNNIKPVENSNAVVVETEDVTENVGCRNGEQPDENGCCSGEVYTELDGSWYCCPEDNPEADCLEPLGK